MVAIEIKLNRIITRGFPFTTLLEDVPIKFIAAKGSPMYIRIVNENAAVAAAVMSYKSSSVPANVK